MSVSGSSDRSMATWACNARKWQTIRLLLTDESRTLPLKVRLHAEKREMKRKVHSQGRERPVAYCGPSYLRVIPGSYSAIASSPGFWIPVLRVHSSGEMQRLTWVVSAKGKKVKGKKNAGMSFDSKPQSFTRHDHRRDVIITHLFWHQRNGQLWPLNQGCLPDCRNYFDDRNYVILS